MKKAITLLLGAVAVLAFWRRRQSSTPSNRERLRARASELAASERTRAAHLWRRVRDRPDRGQ